MQYIELTSRWKACFRQAQRVLYKLHGVGHIPSQSALQTSGLSKTKESNVSIDRQLQYQRLIWNIWSFLGLGAGAPEPAHWGS